MMLIVKFFYHNLIVTIGISLINFGRRLVKKVKKRIN